MQNAGATAWDPNAASRIMLSYHWLDLRGNAIVRDGLRTTLPVVLPGATFAVSAALRCPVPPGRYRLAFDLISEGRFWFEEAGGAPFAVDVDVQPRVSAGTLTLRFASGAAERIAETVSALRAQGVELRDDGEITAFLIAGCRPADDWHARTLHAHREGYAFVGGSIAVPSRRFRPRQGPTELRHWAPGFGRMPDWQHPLLCPTVTSDVVDRIPWVPQIARLPALDPRLSDEPWLIDGRIRITIDAADLAVGSDCGRATDSP